MVGTRWKDSFDAFAAADQQQAPQAGGVLFVGNSSIRLWSGLETQFADQPVLKRGFGSSRMLDVAAQVHQLVLPYKPRLVVVYAGDNDLAEGRSPLEVFASFTHPVEQVHAVLGAGQDVGHGDGARGGGRGRHGREPWRGSLLSGNGA
ncbi:hypothetical protein ISF6_3870 [Piscinibacter sakaiensis]|uniref:SGNH hydrolase-type esterase domain-containing protein n=1 Tax=Piscinibacter sakaiensis TaxID=1547922 RepID=A0A0K8NUL3_PISS1|nr:hypothetical protein ISF6_3870 [Piscinibacter sakaiensis]